MSLRNSFKSPSLSSKAVLYSTARRRCSEPLKSLAAFKALLMHFPSPATAMRFHISAVGLNLEFKTPDDPGEPPLNRVRMRIWFVRTEKSRDETAYC